MRLTAEPIDIGTRTPTVLLNSADASEIGVHPLDRVRIQFDGGTTTGIVEVTDELVSRGVLGVTRPLGHVTGPVDVVVADKPESVVHLREKLVGEELEIEELRTIVEDIERDRLNDVELSAFVSGVFANGLSREEMQSLTSCMVDVGETLEWEQAPIGDKHSIGGVAGNRVTPIVVAIVAAAGVPIPKTSSRAVTSAAGTADTLEVFCDVEFTLEEIREIVDRTNGCMVWGGSVDLSPVDDKIIRAETPLSIDPKGQIVASVLSKKKSAGSTHVVIDIPYGEGAKVETLSEAREIARDFNRVGQGLGMEIDCAITRGEQPVGRGVGPVLEARDVLAVLEGDGPDDLRIKSERLAQMLLDATGVEASAREILADGRAVEKFREIVDTQRGDPDVSVDDLVPGQHVAAYTADRDGMVTHVDNRRVNELARRAGAPKDIRAGVCLDCRVGERIQKGTELLTIHAQKESKLEQALSFAGANTPVRVLPEDEALVEQL
ncbi:AMP phosphorylase [Halapricum hydrolyticum]|uniref:AMP phosphorylase n=1 Tax=Halapricum hydrolyticum TaxID=2979991 RepID=A0AAE3LI93_9EURY|nr:AMP phosphorylase [Halapricum hydrolyticum]MCU4717106.1 AMP phosphorylase [Halapricum hydrolyticum]MCU4726033.1 AMP phosphorylase [Halapricum hydrolyticum]